VKNTKRQSKVRIQAREASLTRLVWRKRYQAYGPCRTGPPSTSKLHPAYSHLWNKKRKDVDTPKRLAASVEHLQFSDLRSKLRTLFYKPDRRVLRKKDEKWSSWQGLPLWVKTSAKISIETGILHFSYQLILAIPQPHFHQVLILVDNVRKDPTRLS
jgi:hypothetical protein